MTDPIADMLTRIRNAQAVKKGEVLVPFSKIKMAIAKILQEEGYIEDRQVVKTTNKLGSEFEMIKINLLYSEDDRQPVIRQIKKISKPGCRVYVNHSQLPHVLGGYGIAIVSTSQGLMTNKRAKKEKIGGELICEIY